MSGELSLKDAKKAAKLGGAPEGNQNASKTLIKKEKDTKTTGSASPSADPKEAQQAEKAKQPRPRKRKASPSACPLDYFFTALSSFPC